MINFFQNKDKPSENLVEPWRKWGMDHDRELYRNRPAPATNPREECGVFGIINNRYAANLTYLGLYALQHRGQESAGITTSDGTNLYRFASMGQVAQVFNEKKLAELEGKMAIGHNRYSTTGASFYRNAQPLRVYTHHGPIALAHNGNLTNTLTLRKQLEQQGSIFHTTIDSEVIVHLMAKCLEKKQLDAIIYALNQIEGAYSLLMLTKDQLIAVRDPLGFRPLAMGKIDDSIIFSSETCALDIVDAEYIRDVEPGEMIVVDQQNQIQSYFPFDNKKFPKSKYLCIFEHIYFSRPDSYIFGESVYNFRLRLGRQLAREAHVDADLISPVPDSSVAAAIGYSEFSQVPFATGLIRSHYIGRTFIEPEQKIRDFGAKIKYNVIAAAVKDKKIILVDDSIMRGTTARKIIKMLRRAGVKEIHMRISAPPTQFPCYYGIDIPTSEELIASNYNLEHIRQYIGVDTLAYISLDGLLAASEIEQEFCTACFTGRYPISPEKNYGSKQKLLFKEMHIEENN